MKPRIFHLLLILALSIGGALAWQTGRERSRLTERYRRLAQVTGDLPIEDPSKAYVLALNTGDPLHYAWRVHFPRNSMLILTDSTGSQSSSWSSTPAEFIARVRIREDDQGRLELYTHFSGGSSRTSLGDKSLSDMLRGRWNEIRVQQLGAGAVAAIDPARPVVLLRLTLPETMLDEARRKLTPYTSGRHVPAVLSLQIGPTAPKP